MTNFNYSLAINQEIWEEASLRGEKAADLKDKFIRSFFKRPTTLLSVLGRNYDLATALDASYYGLDAPYISN